MMKPRVRPRSGLAASEATVLRASASANHASGPLDTPNAGASFAKHDVAAWMPRRGSADADMLRDLPMLVGRSRDLERNNGIARGGIQTIVDNVVGTGLRLSARPDYKALGQEKAWAQDWSAQVESLFCSWWWSTACDAADRQTGDQISQRVLRAWLSNGEALALPLWLPSRGDGFATKIQTVESDRLSNPDGRADSLSLRGGVELDGYGAPTAYWVRRVHPGDFALGEASFLPLWERVPRRTDFGRIRVLHVLDIERDGQTRGKPLISSILPMFKQVDRYIGAELMAAVVNAMVAGIITTPLDQDNILDLFHKDHTAYLKAREQFAVRLDAGSILPLFPGDEFSSHTPSRPATAFGAFLENMLRFMAVGMDMPYELLVKDFSKTNYSSARASMLEAWRAFNRRRDAIGSLWYDPIFGLWLEEVVNDGRIKAPDFYVNGRINPAYLRCRWIGPGRGWVDPVKEATAAAIRIDGNLSTLEDECAEQGKDYREVLEQRAVEIALAKKLGIPAIAPTTLRTTSTENADGTEPAPGGAPGGAPPDNAPARSGTRTETLEVTFGPR